MGAGRGEAGHPGVLWDGGEWRWGAGGVRRGKVQWEVAGYGETADDGRVMVCQFQMMCPC